MTNEFTNGAEKYQKVHRRRSIWHRVISVLSAVTVFITTYAMILPAITMEPSPGIRLDRGFLYEDDQVLMLFQVDGRAVFQNPKDEPDELSANNVTLTVAPLEEESTARQQYETYAEENIGSDDLYELLTMRLSFTYEDAPLDMRNCLIDVEVVAKEEVLPIADAQPAPMAKTMTFAAAAPAAATTTQDSDQVMALTAFQSVGSDLSQQDTAYMTPDTQVLSVNTNLSGDTMAVALYSTVNPGYSVQYYSYTEILASSGDKTLDEIDTSGGKLPVNGGPNSMKNIYLNAIGNGKYVLATQTVLSKLQHSDSFEYVKAPGVAYVDKLRENGNYALKEVWVLKSGKSADSVNKADWTVYPATVSFTNRAGSASSNRIYIADGTVIRLIYNETSGSYTNAADFYDYDISSGKHTVSGGITTAYTSNYGINRFTAASGTVKYAFGNSNTNTDFKDHVWTQNGKANTLNQYNRVNTTYDGCTFGLVTGINDDGTMIFASGISAPVLFGKKNGTGKTYYDDYSLQFSRSGDTYTLVAVNGTNTKNLDQFNNPSPYSGKVYSHIFTNNFWPMDSAPSWGATGHDPKFGKYTSYTNGTILAAGSSNTSAFPASDDGIEHNSYFGMQYSLTFELTRDYAGPLDYVFYGDDDMWVFLDGQLVCDIGGVHSSVGQYVNLRDYIDKMPDSQKYGKHTLYFCYTERGASGSSCYMRFTLPSVSIDTPQVESNTLELGKQVINSNTDREFEFAIGLTDSTGAALADDYSYTRYDFAGTAIESGIINTDENIVKLRNGEKVIINYLPDGTKFSITETAVNGYHTVYSINAAATVEGNTASGTLNTDVTVLFLNATGTILPATGGFGIGLFALPLGCAVAFMLSLPLLEQAWVKRKRKD